jgi:hypothetical protein
MQDQDSSVFFYSSSPKTGLLDDIQVDPSWLPESESTKLQKSLHRPFTEDRKVKNSESTLKSNRISYIINKISTSKDSSYFNMRKDRKNSKKSSLISHGTKGNPSKVTRKRQEIYSNSSIITKKRRISSKTVKTITNIPKKPKITKTLKITVLKLFKTSKGYGLKYENLRIFIIRRFKKYIRLLLDGLSNKKLKKIENLNDFTSQEENLRVFIKMNEDEFFYISKTESGPNTDGKNKRKEQAQYLSWNNQYFKQFFSSDIVKRGYLLYVKIVFRDIKCEVLRVFFKLDPVSHISKKCCNERCLESWKELERYYSKTILTNLK